MELNLLLFLPSKNIKKNIFVLTISALVFSSTIAFSQDDDLMNELNKSQIEAKEEPVIGTFNSTRLINVHTNETVGKNVLELRVTHRFGALEGGAHSFAGLDASSDIHIGFDYGITSRLMVGIGRSKISERYDGFVKYRLLRQTETKIPISVTLFGNATIDAQKRAKFEVGNQTFDNYPNFPSRINYLASVIISRKFGKRFSAMLSPTLFYRNYIGSYSSDFYIKENGKSSLQTYSAVVNSNTLFALGGGVRYRISHMLTITADAAYPFSSYLNNKPKSATPYNIPIGVGVELEVGGHIFSINATNSEAILPNQYFIASATGWNNWGSRLGFTIVRVFTPGKRIVKKRNAHQSEVQEVLPKNEKNKSKSKRDRED